MKRRYYFLLAGIIAMILFKEVGIIFATIMVGAFFVDKMFSKSYSPWKNANTQEDYSKNKKLDLSELESLK